VSVKNSKKSYHGYNTEVFYRVKTLPISALWETTRLKTMWPIPTWAATAYVMSFHTKKLAGNERSAYALAARLSPLEVNRQSFSRLLTGRGCGAFKKKRLIVFSSLFIVRSCSCQRNLRLISLRGLVLLRLKSPCALCSLKQIRNTRYARPNTNLHRDFKAVLHKAAVVVNTFTV